MFEDVFEGKIEDKFFEILYNANRDICTNEIDKLVKRCVALEILLEGTFEDIDKEIRSTQIMKSTEIDGKTTNTYMEMMASILSQNE